MQRTILVTGCSSGIGAALALEFRRRGHRVYATARRRETLTPLEAQGLEALTLDVNDDTSVEAALATIRRDVGQLDVLVNNAGFSQVGAAIDLTREDLRRQYETNVIAPVALTGRVVPLLRAAVARSGHATVANVGSIVGLFTTPFAGAYCSSKAALHSLTDALRMELAPFGIRVVSVQPGGVRSSFAEHATAALRLPEDSIYRQAESGLLARARASQQGATPTEAFVVPVVEALLRDSPPSVIRGGAGSTWLPLLARLLPGAVLDSLLAKRFGLDVLGRSPAQGDRSG